MGFDKYVKHSYTKTKHYYLVEDYAALKALEDYLTSAIIK